MADRNWSCSGDSFVDDVARHVTLERAPELRLFPALGEDVVAEAAEAVQLKRQQRRERRQQDVTEVIREQHGRRRRRVIAGNIGPPSRMEFTVIGDAVNLAWRLQEHTKGATSNILLGENTIALLGGEFPVEMLGVYQMNEQVSVRYGCPAEVVPELLGLA